VIDIENEVFNTVATALRAAFKGIFVSGETVAALSSFPAATLVEMDDSVYEKTMDSSYTENHALKMWQAEAYSNKSSGKKTECKSIMSAIDDEMLKLGFVRVGCGPMALPNADATKYRMVARYRAVISKEKLVYRR
jgi:hypothetical protein